MNTVQNGKGSAPRSVSKKFKANYDQIDWGHPKQREQDKAFDESWHAKRQASMAKFEQNARLTPVAASR